MRWLIPLIVLAISAVAVVVVLARDDKGDVAGAPSPSPSASVAPQATSKVGQVASFSGTNNLTTKTFTVAPNWELRWQADNPAAFNVELLDAKVASRGMIVTSPKKKSGTTFVTDKGSFQLRVTAMGPWSIQVVSQRPSSRVSAAPSPTARR